jgi:hypothetical protein
MTPIMFRRLVLNTGAYAERCFYPEPNVRDLLPALCARWGYVSLPAPMSGYGLELVEACDGTGGLFHIWLEQGGPPVRYSTCFYCASEEAAGSRFTEAVESHRAAVLAGQARACPTRLSQPRSLPWVAALRWRVPFAPPEAPVLEDAVFTALVAGQPTACSSRALPGWL